MTPNASGQKLTERRLTERRITERRTSAVLSSSNAGYELLCFSQVLNFVNTDETIKESAKSCHFLSEEHNLTSVRSENDTKPITKKFHYSEKLKKIERVDHRAEDLTKSQNTRKTQQLI